MPKGTNNMENKSNEQSIIMQSEIENNKQNMKSGIKSNKQDSDDKMIQFKSEMKSNKQDSDEEIMKFT